MRLEKHPRIKYEKEKYEEWLKLYKLLLNAERSYYKKKMNEFKYNEFEKQQEKEKYEHWLKYYKINLSKGKTSHKELIKKIETSHKELIKN